MQLEELSVSNNMETEVLQGLNYPSRERLGAISEAAKRPQISELEAESVKMGINEVVKNLGKENQEMFPNKDEVAETVAISKEAEGKGMNKELVEKKIMGMKPLAFGLLVIALGVGGYFVYKKYGKGKK